MKAVYLLVLTLLSGCTAEYDDFVESRLKISAESFCSCYGGVQTMIPLRGLLSARVRCTNGVSQVIVPVEYKPCSLRVKGH